MQQLYQDDYIYDNRLLLQQTQVSFMAALTISEKPQVLVIIVAREIND